MCRLEKIPRHNLRFRLMLVKEKNGENSLKRWKGCNMFARQDSSSRQKTVRMQLEIDSGFQHFNVTRCFIFGTLISTRWFVSLLWASNCGHHSTESVRVDNNKEARETARTGLHVAPSLKDAKVDCCIQFIVKFTISRLIYKQISPISTKLVYDFVSFGSCTRWSGWSPPSSSLMRFDDSCLLDPASFSVDWNWGDMSNLVASRRAIVA